MGHLTLTTTIRGCFDIRRLTLDTLYLHTKFSDSRFSRSGDMMAGVKIVNGSCDLTTPLLRVLCYLKTMTCYSPPVCKFWWF